MRPSSIPKKRWQLFPTAPATLRQRFSHLSPVLVQILYNRGLTTEAQVQGFLEGHYLASTDPMLLEDMETAVNRIGTARQNDETIIVYGDFDADGVTSTVLLVEALRGLKGMERRKVIPYIPDRVDEGYGLNIEALNKIKLEMGADLVISVDCGIRSVAEVAHAREIGLDMIVTDHHSLGRELPPALAVINPKRPNSAYPETMLAGVGIAYKLAQALHYEMASYEGFSTQNLLDLVAIGTVADVAPLLGENRKLVVEGLEVLNTLQRPGVSALAHVAGVRAGMITAETIGFALGPRINAAGRLDHAYSAAKLLATDNLLQATQFANQLNELNRKRQAITSELTQHAELLLENRDDYLLFAADDKFLPGVVGLVASRLKENYYRPTIVVEMGETESHGSCRSIDEFHITDALDQVGHLLLRHGGHAQAAGFAIANTNLPAFSAAMKAIAAEQLAGQELVPSITIDAEVAVEDVDWALYETFQQLEPTGAANPTPVLVARQVEVINARAVGKDSNHLQIELAAGGTRSIKGIGFQQGAWANCLPSHVDVVYTISINEWNGRRMLQLNIQDINPSKE